MMPEIVDGRDFPGVAKLGMDTMRGEGYGLA
jgi:hypothetical protein